MHNSIYSVVPFKQIKPPQFIYTDMVYDGYVLGMLLE